ncbi:hypothetical protein [Abyssalbus ytuae]|uniref:Uncharacterized protein n=1 Tax=Abyssalbus ytuae TaxID=2926907 RepID=A0A9E7D3T2_9FLAO|nr:hypothetical protein [Abyssalbus ytuae]UOB18174.1 hypothetical protein MQE35_02475 [Abyssalbus ytuae]
MEKYTKDQILEDTKSLTMEKIKKYKYVGIDEKQKGKIDKQIEKTVKKCENKLKKEKIKAEDINDYVEYFFNEIRYDLLLKSGILVLDIFNENEIIKISNEINKEIKKRRKNFKGSYKDSETLQLAQKLVEEDRYKELREERKLSMNSNGTCIYELSYDNILHNSSEVNVPSQKTTKGSPSASTNSSSTSKVSRSPMKALKAFISPRNQSAKKTIAGDPTVETAKTASSRASTDLKRTKKPSFMWRR